MLIIVIIITILEVIGVTHIIDGFTISKKVPRNIVISKHKHLIPRNIYRTWKTKEVPEKYKKHMILPKNVTQTIHKLYMMIMISILF